MVVIMCVIATNTHSSWSFKGEGYLTGVGLFICELDLELVCALSIYQRNEIWNHSLFTDLLQHNT